MKKLWYKILYFFKCRWCDYKDKKDYWLCGFCAFNNCKEAHDE